MYAYFKIKHWLDSARYVILQHISLYMYFCVHVLVEIKIMEQVVNGKVIHFFPQ